MPTIVLWYAPTRSLWVLRIDLLSDTVSSLGKAPALGVPPYYHVPRVRGTLFEAGRPAAGAAEGKNSAACENCAAGSIFLMFSPGLKWIGLVFGRYLAVSGQDWVINDDRTLSHTCAFQCYSQIMKELTFAIRNTMLTFQVFLEIIKK